MTILPLTVVGIRQSIKLPCKCSKENVLIRLKISLILFFRADMILLNKVDLVSPELKGTMTETINKINSSASLMETQFSKLDLDMILDLHAVSKIE